MTPGVTEEITAGVRRLIAPNPGPMTYWGTNTYLVGTKDIAVVDPGPAMAEHLDAILEATRGARITQILITHAHLDHSSLATQLKKVTGAPAMAFGRATDGRTAIMQRLATEGVDEGGEGVDAAFAPDGVLSDSTPVPAGDVTLDVIHTPGHFAGHLAFRLGDLLFSGDHVMDWSTTLISPPDGDLTAFMASTRKLRGIGLAQMLPGHGAPVSDPNSRLNALLRHREAREAQIVEALAQGPACLAEITRRVYTDINPALLPAAERNAFAHLIDLETRSRITATPHLSANATFALKDPA